VICRRKKRAKERDAKMVETRQMNIVFVYRHLSSFVYGDLQALSDKFNVFPVRVSKTLISGIVNLTRFTPKCDLVFVWFAGFQAVLATIFARLAGKKLIVVAGGYEVAYVPEFKYGAYFSWYRALMATFAFKNADVIIAVSESTKRELYQRLVPKGNVVTIYNGIDTNLFKPDDISKENTVLTVAMINKDNIKIKGLDMFVKTAAHLQDADFILVGDHDNSIVSLTEQAPKSFRNVEYSRHAAIDYYQKAKVYAQLSFHESFGVSVVEAMSCGCVPVVTTRGGLPEVVGDCGFYVPYGDVEAAAEAIEKALSDTNLGKRARRRAVDMFSKEIHNKKLLELVENYGHR
jgi:glycosyltransferase involved in cell wall biosynthesis